MSQQKYKTFPEKIYSQQESLLGNSKEKNCFQFRKNNFELTQNDSKTKFNSKRT